MKMWLVVLCSSCNKSSRG